MIGILAYGSLIDDPKKEIEKIVTKKIEGVKTPFPVEFARSSDSRDGAPTLIPFKNGAKVNASILVLEEHVDIAEAKNKLWRRETNKVESKESYNRPSNPSENSVIIEELKNFTSFESVLYTNIGNNIDSLTPKKLAKLAVESVKGEAGKLERDGITYLINAKRNGIKTPLSPQYGKEILKITGERNLAEARKSIINKNNA